MKPIAWSAGLRMLRDRFSSYIAVSDASCRQLPYSDLHDRAHTLARFLLANGIQPGQPFGTLFPNAVDAVWASYGVRMSGAADVPISWRSTPEEIAWFAQLSGFTHVVTVPERLADVEALGLTAVSSEEVLRSSHTQILDDDLPAIPADQCGRVLFTSGTTGKPKGVQYTHGARWMGEQMLKASMPFVPSPGDKILLMTPFVHGSSLLTYAWCDFGAEVVLIDGVDLPFITRLLDSAEPCAIFAPPTVLAKITAAFEGRHFEHVKCIFTGTQPLTAALYQRARKMFGPVVRITYGKSECVNPITVLSTSETEAYFSQAQIGPGACVGYPAPGVEIKIHANMDVDAEPGDDGEVLLRAPQMSECLLNESGRIEHAEGGWHHTGDLGHFDQAGRLILTGRIADVIKTGGYRVNPDEIEAVLATIDGAGQICVASLPSDYWGEIIISVAEHPPAGWIELAKGKLSGLSKHKHPRLFIEVETLPRNPQGKVSRRQVRAAVLSRFDLMDGAYPEIKPKSDC